MFMWSMSEGVELQQTKHPVPNALKVQVYYNTLNAIVNQAYHNSTPVLLIKLLST